MAPRILDAGGMLNEPKVHDISTLGLSNDKEAKEMLASIAKQVQPIMRKRQWIVPKLSEFLPSNPNLLGINIGGGGGRTKEIKIRLRPSSNPSTFLRIESLIETMLHELVHNVRGPHDSIFYKLLDELKAECEDLMSRGISGTGAGFDASSTGRLGSHAFIPIHNPSEDKMRDVALRAAEKRLTKQRLMSNGPVRLGGDASAVRSLAPGQAAAMAAERRRAMDNRWCPNEVIREALDAASKRAEDKRKGASASNKKTEIDYIVLDDADELEAVLASQVEEDQGVNEGEGEEERQGGRDQRGASSSSASFSPGERLLSRLKASSRLKREKGEAEAEGKKGGKVKTSASAANNVVDLTMDSDEDHRGKVKRPAKKSSGSRGKMMRQERQSWQCLSCFIVNPGSNRQCSICLASAPIG